MSKQETLSARDVARLHDAPDPKPPAIIPATDAPIFDVIRSMASDKEADVDKFERLVALYERQEARGAERAFNDAMNAVQEEIRPIAADANNPQTRSKYASYLALDKALRPIYTRHGFSLSFDTGEGQADAVRVLCYVSHNAGHSRTYKIDMPADGKGAKGGDVMTKTHATGAAMTYGQRYLLKMIFNIAVGEDSDGNGVDGGRITDAQAQTIRDLAERVGADLEKFCAFMKVEAVPDIASKDYEKAITALNLKQGQKKA